MDGGMLRKTAMWISGLVPGIFASACRAEAAIPTTTGEPWLNPETALSLIVLLLIAQVLTGGALVLCWRWGRRRFTTLREQLIDAVDNIPEGFVLCDAEDRLVVCNEQYCRMYPGVEERVIPGTSFIEIIRWFIDTYPAIGFEESKKELLARRLRHHHNPGIPFEYELQDGRRIRITERRTRDGGVVGIHSDITDVRRTHERLRHLANHDSLTGLPNRSYGQERLEQVLAQARQQNRCFAVMFLDLDRFKQINDTLGHHVGDELLQAVAQRLRGHLRDQDTLARLGGDEFMVIMDQFDDPSAIAITAQRLVEALAQPFQVNSHEVSVTTSIGIACFPEDGDDIPSLMQNADAASYQAKAQGPNNYRFYSPEPHIARA